MGLPRTLQAGIGIASRRVMARDSWWVLALAVVAGAPALDFGFVYDDYWTVVTNRFLEQDLGQLMRGALSGELLRRGMPDATRPAMSWSLWLDRMVFGLSPWGHHLQSLLVHGAASVSAYWAAWSLTRRRLGALVAGVCFAVLPAHAEVVAAVNYREDSLSAACMFLGLTVVLWPSRALGVRRSAAASTLWMVALLAKESAITWPIWVGLCWLALPRGKRPRVGSWSQVLVPPAVVLLLWGNWRFGMATLGGQIPRAQHQSLQETLGRFARFEWHGLWHALVPVQACPEYPLGSEPGWLWLFLGVAVACAAVWVGWHYRVWEGRKGGIVLMALGTALVLPLAASPLAAPVNERADRYFYAATFAVALLAGTAFIQLRRCVRAGPPLGLVVLAGVGLWGSQVQVATWGSETALWIRALECAPESPRVWASLARANRHAEHDELASRAAERALQLDPTYFPARVTQVYNHLWFGRKEQALGLLKSMAPSTSLQKRALRTATRCAQQASAKSAAECARKTVPSGEVLGDVDRLRQATKQGIVSLKSSS